jgi:7-cyano-7-deazaguanine synthase in queuosine biosynthesis
MEYNIDGVNIPFNKEWESIAISLSGGADSALLAYILCDIIEKEKRDVTIHIISHTRMWKTRPWQEVDSLRVYQWLYEYFHCPTWYRHVNFIAPELEYGNIGPSLTDEYGKQVSGDNIQQRAYAEYICDKYNIDAYYNAVTRNPSHLSGMTERNIESNENNQHLRLMKHMDRYAVHPFRFVQKDWIIKQYINYNIAKDLLLMTRSCEGEFAGIDYKTYVMDQYVPICGECFWCKEREWAIEQNK